MHHEGRVAACKRRRRIVCACLSLLLVIAPTAVAVGPHGGGSTIDVEVGMTYDSNITLAELDDDILSDLSLAVALMQTTTRGIGFDTAWGWNVRADGRTFRDHSDLDELEVGIGLFLRHQPGRGFGAPVIEVGVSAAFIDSASDIRDGHTTQAGAMLTRRLTDRVAVRLGVRHTRRSARSGSVFNLSRNNVFVSADWFPRRNRVVYATWAHATGDVVSTAEPTLKIINAASAIEPDDAFGGADANRFAYRLDADVHILTLGMNLALGRHRSVDVSVQGLTASAEGGNDYDRLSTRLAWLQRF